MNKTTYTGMVALCLTIALLVGIAAAAGVFFRGDGGSIEVESVRGERPAQR